MAVGLTARITRRPLTSTPSTATGSAIVRLVPVTACPAAPPPIATASSVALPSSVGVNVSAVEPLVAPAGIVALRAPDTAYAPDPRVRATVTGVDGAVSTVAVTVTSCAPRLSPMRSGWTDSVSGAATAGSLSSMVSVRGRETSAVGGGSVPGFASVQWPSTTSVSSPSASASSTTVMSFVRAVQPFSATSFVTFGNVTSAGVRASPPAPSRSRHFVYAPRAGGCSSVSRSFTSPAPSDSVRVSAPTTMVGGGGGSAMVSVASLTA